MSASGESEAPSHRVLETVVKGVCTEDEYALLETTDGAQSQFVLLKSLAGEAWDAIQVGSLVVVEVVVTIGRTGRVVKVLSATSRST